MLPRSRRKRRGIFQPGLADARAILPEVGAAVAKWRDAAAHLGARPSEIGRMVAAFEHDDLARAKAM